MPRWPKTLGRWLLLGVVCAAVYASLSIPGALRQRIIAAANTTTIVFAMTADTWSHGDLAPRVGSLAGPRYTITKRPSDLIATTSANIPHND